MQWSYKEENFLKKFYRNTSNNLLAKVLGKSRSAINHKGLRMGMGKAENNPRYIVNNAGRHYKPRTFK